jgi:hypothetical protein
MEKARRKPGFFLMRVRSQCSDYWPQPSPADSIEAVVLSKL